MQVQILSTIGHHIEAHCKRSTAWTTVVNPRRVGQCSQCASIWCCALLAKWHRNGFVIRSRVFDSPTGHHAISVCRLARSSRLLWEQETASSNLATPTIFIRLYAAALRTQRKLMDTCGFDSCQPGHKLFYLTLRAVG